MCHDYTPLEHEVNRENAPERDRHGGRCWSDEVALERGDLATRITPSILLVFNHFCTDSPYVSKCRGFLTKLAKI
jgi:hypothetical protein